MTVAASQGIGVYNKLFTKILDSSIWLAPDPHRLVWITLIAAMDEDGNAMFACADNVAARARVPLYEAEAAIKAFEAPDPKSGDPDYEGRRIERFPGGWKVLNAHKYRAAVTKAIIREQTRARTEKWRERKRGDAPVTQSDETVTPSEALSEAEAVKDMAAKRPPMTARFADFWAVYPKKVKKKDAEKVWKSKQLDSSADALIADVRRRQSEDRRWLSGFVCDPPVYLRGERWNDAIEPVTKNGNGQHAADAAAKERTQILDLASLFGLKQGRSEEWSDFRTRVTDLNERRLASLERDQ